MMRSLLLLTVLFVSTTLLKAQTAEDSVKATVNLLFEGMKTSDAEKVKGAFSDSAILQTIVQREGKVSVRSEKMEGFASSVSQAEKGSLDERIQFETVKVDGNLAIAWTPYKFYYKGNFSHCGVNSFQLVRINGAWKIQYLIDTRRRNECDNVIM